MESDPNFVLRWWPHTLSKLRVKLKVKLEMIHVEKKGPKWFSPKNWSSQEFHPYLGFMLPTPSVLIIFYIKIKLCQNIIMQIFWTKTQFHYIVLNFVHFMATFKLVMKWGLWGQIRAQKQGDFNEYFIILTRRHVSVKDPLIQEIYKTHVASLWCTNTFMRCSPMYAMYAISNKVIHKVIFGFNLPLM